MYELNNIYNINKYTSRRRGPYTLGFITAAVDKRVKLWIDLIAKDHNILQYRFIISAIAASL